MDATVQAVQRRIIAIGYSVGAADADGIQQRQIDDIKQAQVGRYSVRGVLLDLRERHQPTTRSMMLSEADHRA